MSKGQNSDYSTNISNTSPLSQMFCKSCKNYGCCDFFNGTENEEADDEDDAIRSAPSVIAQRHLK